MQVKHSSPVVKSVNPSLLSESLAISGDIVRFVAIVFVAVAQKIVFAVGWVWWFFVPGKRK
jgi:hypothetical protein